MSGGWSSKALTWGEYINSSLSIEPCLALCRDERVSTRGRWIDSSKTDLDAALCSTRRILYAVADVARV